MEVALDWIGLLSKVTVTGPKCPKQKGVKDMRFLQKFPSSRCFEFLLVWFVSLWKIRCFLAGILRFGVIGGDFPKMVILRISVYTEFSKRLRE